MKKVILNPENNMTDIINTLTAAIPGLKILKNEPMSAHTSFHIGGPAELFIQPDSTLQLVACLDKLREEGVKPIIIGRGSNLLVRDGGIPGAVIALSDNFSRVETESDSIYAYAGASLAATAYAAMQAGLAGMEFAHGIPGSVGGGVMMNAGAYGGEMKDIVEYVRCLSPEGELLEISDCGFSYRHSRFEEPGWIILGAKLRLERDDSTAIWGRMKTLMNKRIASQPLDKPSAGSTFKRPVGGYAAAMIDQAGLKGFRIGGAAVSEKHAGFVVNLGGATCADVEAVMAHVQQEVEKKFGVALEPEVKIVG